MGACLSGASVPHHDDVASEILQIAIRVRAVETYWRFIVEMYASFMSEDTEAMAVLLNLENRISRLDYEVGKLVDGRSTPIDEADPILQCLNSDKNWSYHEGRPPPEGETMFRTILDFTYDTHTWIEETRMSLVSNTFITALRNVVSSITVWDDLMFGDVTVPRP